MRKTIQGLYERYRAHHDMDRPLLPWIGVVGCLAFPLFYMLRRTSALPPLYDDLPLRLVASAMCLALALKAVWPRSLKRYYVAYSYATVFYCLSFLLSFTMLKNQGGTPSVVNMVMGAIIIILLADWRNAVLMLVAGYVVSIAAYAGTEPAPRIPPEFVISAAGSVLVVIAGALSNYGQKRAEVERMRRLYAGLAGSIAHEVRTPLAQVQHALEAVRERVAADPVLARAVAQGQGAIRRGLQAVELTLRQLKEDTPDATVFRDLSAADCARKAIEEFAYELPEQRDRVSVQADSDFVFRGDETTVMLVLFNLLKNALYYVPVAPHMRITLRVECDPVRRIVVHDTGPGIAAEQRARLFENFQTLGKAEGTGLGLAFCRRAMRALDGDIQCESRPGWFTEFALSFPPAQQGADVLAPAAAIDGPAIDICLSGRRVLVVDDSAMNRTIARARLSGMGAVVAEAPHAAEALRILREGADPDAIVMDMNMPGMSGVEATRALRAMPGPAGRIPVLLVTADPTASARQIAFAAGVDGFLVKPLEPHSLGAELARLMPQTSSHSLRI